MLQISYSGMNWASARQECLAWGGDLATFTSLEEYNLMLSTITAASFCFVGLNDLDSEGTWVWVDGNNSTYRNWHPDQPDDLNNEDCSWTWFNELVDDIWCTELSTCSFCSKIG